MAMINPRVDESIDLYFVFCDTKILVDENNKLPSNKDIEHFFLQHLISDWFTDSEYNFTAFLFEDSQIHIPCYKWILLYDFFALYEENKSLLLKSSRAKALLMWRKSSRFCGYCGNQMFDEKSFLARTCNFCKNTTFPRLSPAIIVLVTKGDFVLLAKHKNRNTDVYTCLAGFIECGETVDQCITREIKEECGITVKNIRYVTSQSWPYPDQLMLAFTAEWEKGSIVPQKDEIDDAQWFNKQDLPCIPAKGTVAYSLIQQLSSYSS
ncbi:MAG: NAD(+) diphosphatase [Treponemataceae bacterium]